MNLELNIMLLNKETEEDKREEKEERGRILKGR
jgi:hypothetical protein